MTVTFADRDRVPYPIAQGSPFSLFHAAGSTPAVDNEITVTVSGDIDLALKRFSRHTMMTCLKLR